MVQVADLSVRQRQVLYALTQPNPQIGPLYPDEIRDAIYRLLPGAIELSWQAHKEVLDALIWLKQLGLVEGTKAARATPAGIQLALNLDREALYS